MWMISRLPPNKILHSELELRDHLVPIFFPSYWTKTYHMQSLQEKKKKNLLKSLHTLKKMALWMMNLPPRSVGFFNLLLHLISIMSFLLYWSLPRLSESRLKLLILRHVVSIKTHSSSFWMTRSWIFWTSKSKQRLGLNLFTTSIQFSQRYFFWSNLLSHILNY